MDQRIIELYDRFTHGGMSRRDFMDRLTGIAGSTAAAAAILPVLGNDYARAAIVAEDDARLVLEDVQYDSPQGPVRGVLARPRDAQGDLPAVIVIHENRGLNPHIRDVGRRLALEGFVTLSVDMLTPLGGTPADEDKAREMIGQLDAGETEQRLAAAIPYLAGLDGANGNVGATGFCWGGGMVNRLAAVSPELDAGVAWYGAQVPADRVPGIEAALMLHYAGIDERINAGIAAYEAALKDAGKDYVVHMYEGANHAFNNDTNAARYDKAAADLAWRRTVDFFKEKLGS